MMLKSNRLKFLQWHKSDFNQLKTILGNPNVCRYLPGEASKSDQEIGKWLNYFVKTFGDQNGNEIYKVKLKDTQQVIGYCGLGFVKEFGKIEIMYGLDEAFWQHGFGYEMSVRMKKLALARGHKELIALADIRNNASNKILNKIGYQRMKQINLWGLDLNYYEMKLDSKGDKNV